MPNVSAHLVVAKLVSEKINIQGEDFIRGNMLPDLMDKEKSHYYKRSGLYLVPDIDSFFKYQNINTEQNVGYLTHLLLDIHFLEYLEKKYPGIDCFEDKTIYEDYSNLNAKLVDKFNLDVDYLEKVLTNYNCKVDEDLLSLHIFYMKQRRVGENKYLDFDSYTNFLIEISDIISKELINYANKYNGLPIRFR